jgi:hypothetical protein
MGLVTVAWWGLFVLCVVGLVWSRGRRSAANRAAADETAPEELEPRVPRLPKALQDPAVPAAGAARRPVFSEFEREILAPVLTADVGPDGVRCPGCVDGAVRRYVHRPIRTPEVIEADVWCPSCGRHMTLTGPGDQVDFDDPLAHLDDAQRDEISRDLDEYLGGLDLLWSQGTLPQTLRRRSVSTP